MIRKSGARILVASALVVGAALGLSGSGALAQRAEPAAKAAAPKAAAARRPVPGFRDCPTCPEMVRIPAGAFLMGSADDEDGRGPDEGPLREVKVKAFAASRFEITFDEWDACVADGGCPGRPASPPPMAAAAAPAAAPGGETQLTPELLAQIRQFVGTDQAALARVAEENDLDPAELQALLAQPPATARQAQAPAPARGGRGAAPAEPQVGGDDANFGRGKRPAINISWNEAQAYVAWLSRKTGKKYRLLTEAEWEYAARAGAKTRYFWGQEPSREHANFTGSGGKDTFASTTAPVGTFEPNAFGLHDVSGNAAEWVQDCWAPSYEGAPSDGAPREGGECVSRVLRGASWISDPALQRLANRDWVGPDYRSSSTGFRIARDL